TFVFENRVGAGGNTGIAAVAKAPTDGYTIGIGTTGPLTINPHMLGDKMPFKPNEIRPLVAMATQPNLIVVHNSIPAKNITELVAYLKANPDKESYASSGAGTSQHLCMEMLADLTGIKVAHVPYRASNQIMQDVMSGQVKITCDNFASAYEQVKAGTVKAVAVTSPERYPGSPEVPTVAEGFPGFRVGVFHGYIAPAGFPADLAKRLEEELVKAINDPDTQAKFKNLGVQPSGLAGDAFAALIKGDSDRYGAAIAKAGIKPAQ
ncbi:MAG: tripartite tricarboxylate transporter substrate binding protein, partial [Hyphomicrobiaceae bacterium]|nr:tripartite tricarboxylate transporter substrate binding protein [Hyphomicrobiaceae bacterium]